MKATINRSLLSHLVKPDFLCVLLRFLCFCGQAKTRDEFTTSSFDGCGSLNLGQRLLSSYCFVRFYKLEGNFVTAKWIQYITYFYISLHFTFV